LGAFLALEGFFHVHFLQLNDQPIRFFADFQDLGIGQISQIVRHVLQSALE
jgi:hypothetical protein